MIGWQEGYLATHFHINFGEKVNMKERVGLIYDPHIPYLAYPTAINYLKNLHPKLTKLVIGGDFVDFYKISFFKNSPNRMSFQDEILIARKELKKLRQQFPKIPIDYIEGNHEVRLHRHVLENAPHLLWNNKIEDMLHLGARNINYISNISRMCKGQEPYKLGKLYVLHGHEKKISFGAINLARLMYTKAKTNVIFGHHHKSDWSLVKKLDGTHEGCWAVGTLGQLSESYQPINDWNWGFAYVNIFDDGDFEVHNKIIINNRILSA